MAIQFDLNQPFQAVEDETLESLTAPRAPRPAAPVVAAPVGPVFDPSKPFTAVADPVAIAPGPLFDPNAPVIKVYGLEEFDAKPSEELVADKDFMPVQFNTQHETELTPEQRTKLEQVYAARETAGTSIKDKAKSFFTGIAPAVKTLAQGVKSAAKVAGKFTPAGVVAEAMNATSAEEFVKAYAKTGAEAAASVELAALGSTDLLRRSARELGEAKLAPINPLNIALRAGNIPKADKTEGDWRNRLSDDTAAARQVEEAGRGNGVVMEALGIDAASLEKDFGIVVDPEEIARLSVVTDPINYVPLGATVGFVGKLGGKLTRGAVAATTTAKQAAKLAEILNTATAAASAGRSVAGKAVGTVAKGVGGAIESVGNVAEKGVRALGGTASGVGLGGLLGGNVYTALGGAAIAKAVPRLTQITGRTVKGAGQILTGEAAAPAALTLAGDTLKAGAAGALKGAAEGGVLILPFEIGARPEEEEQLLGMVGLGAGIRAGVEGVRPGARAAGRAAQNKLAETIFQTVEQSPLAESPTYGTDPLLDSSHAANTANLSGPEQKLVNWGRELLRGAGGEVYVLDTPTFAREAQGNKTARGYAISIGETVGPDGAAKPLFRVFLNKDAEALPHEFFHALTDLDPKRAAAFRDTVKKSLTPDQLRSFEHLYNALLNNGLPEVQWKFRLSPEQVVNEVAAETFSRVFLAQDLSGVSPTVQQKAALFVSSLLEKAGAPLAGVGKKGAPGASSLGVRGSTDSVKLGQTWVRNMVERVNEQGTLGEPPIIAQRPATQTPVPGEVVSRKPAAVKPAPAAPVPTPTPRPTPENPPLPTIPTPAAPTGKRNIRATRAAQDDFAGQRAEVTNVEPARAAAEATGDANTIARVSEISNLIESGSPVIEIEHSGVKAAGTAEAPSGRTARRTEQEAAYIAEGMANAPAPIREAYQKVFVPVRWEVVNGKPQLLAMSLDKVIANAHKAVKESAARGVAERIPYEIVDGKLTENAWGQFVDDLKAYADNQANGYRGDGQKLVRPTEDVGLSIPAENPAYNPRPITEERANFLNLVQGLNPPLTARTGKQSSAVLPGNVKGQVLAEVNLRQPEPPSVIRPEDLTKQEFKTVPGRSVAETNPLRNELAAAGVPVRELIEVTERINAGDINSVRPRPELDFKAPVTDTIRGGFLPGEELTAGRYWLDPTGDFKIVDYAHSDYGSEASLYRKGWIRVVAEENGNGLLVVDLNSATDRVKLNPKQKGAIEAVQSTGAQVNDAFGTFGAFLPGDTAKQISDVQAMSSDEFAAATKSWDGGLTKQAWKIGLDAASPEDVTALKAANVDAGLKARAAIKEKDFNAAGSLASRAQFFREAFEAATDTGSAAGDIGWRVAFPDRQAPFPESKGDFLPSKADLDKVRSGEKDGETFNRDGTVFSPGDRKLDVVTLASENLPAEDLSPERVQAFLSRYPALLESDSIKPGVFRMANGEVSLDLNVVVDQTHRKNTEAFARDNNQQAFFDLVNFQNVETGGSGQTVLTSPEAIAEAAQKLERGEPVTVTPPRGDFMPRREKPMPGSVEEYDARVPRKTVFPKTRKPAKASKQSEANPTAWILPTGEVRPLTGSFHENDLAANSAEFNKKFGTKFSTDSAKIDRVDALNAGFVRVRYQPNNGRMTVEVGARHWGKQKSKVLDNLLSQSEKIDALAINLIDENGKAVDSVGDSVFDADNRNVAITDLVNEVIAPRTRRAANAGPSEIQRMRALPGPGDFLPTDLLDLGLPSEERMKQLRVKTRVSKAKENFPEALVPEYQKDDAGQFVLGEDGKPKPVVQEYRFMETPLAREAAKGLKGAEREEAFTDALAKKLVTAAKQGAKRADIQAGAKWYSTTRTRLKGLLGDDTKFFAELLGATSARTPVDTNFRFAVDAYNQFKAGEFDGIITKYREGKDRWDAGQIEGFPEENPTRGQFLDWWVETNDLKPRQSNGKLFGANSRSVLRVLDGSWRDEVQGPKTPNFAGNLSGDTFEATVDVWAARLLHRLANDGNAKRWRILPENETGVSDADFALGQAAYRKAADKLGMKPDSLQAILWFLEKDEWEKRGWTRGAGAAKSDFQSLLADTEKLESGQLRRKQPQNELDFGLKADDIQKRK